MTSWTSKYRPESLADVVGNDSAVKDLREWANSWEEHHEAVILYGMPGVGKTSAAHALANDHGWEVMEMNASNKRTKSVVKGIGGEAAKTGTLSKGATGRKLVVLDEADNLSGTADRGGKGAMTRLVKNAEQPVILIANEFYDMSRGLRNACQSIEFDSVNQRPIAKALRDICEQEDVEYTADGLKGLAGQADGDLRSAVNDLEALATGGQTVTSDAIATSSRDRSVDIFPYLDSVLKEDAPQDVQRDARDLDESPDDLIRWVEENITKVYSPDELAEAYEFIAQADRWLGLVRSTQDYSFWRYASTNMTAGVAASRSERKGGWTRYGPPRYQSQGKTQQEVAQKVAEVSGASTATVTNAIIPYLSAMTQYCKPRDVTTAMAAHYDLDKSQVAFITGSGKDTNKVAGIVEEAQELREESGVQESTHEMTLDEGYSNQEDEGEDDEDSKDEAVPDVDDTNEDEDEGGEEEDDESQLGLGDFD